jgi:hypothetical protein
MPYLRGVGTRATGEDGEIIVPEEVQRRRDLNTLADQMTYLREMASEASGTWWEHHSTLSATFAIHYRK